MSVCHLDAEAAKTRVLIVDDHYIIRRGLAELLGQENAFIIAGAASSGTEAMKTARLEPFDLAIVDVSLGDMDGIELTRRLKAEHPGLLVLVLSMHDEQIFAERALQAGASGFVAKQEASRTLLHAIDLLLAGKEHFHHSR